MKALVLSGGGANGAYQNGVLQRLGQAVKDGDYSEPDLVVGTSVGAMNGGRLCEYPMGQFFEGTLSVDAEWERLKGNSDVYTPHFWGLVPSALLMFVFQLRKSLYNTQRLQRHILETLDADRIKSSGRHFVCNAVEVGRESETMWFDSNHPEIVYGILASSAFPIFFEPVKIEGLWYTDGGLRDQTAVSKAIELGAEQVDIISCCPSGVEPIDRFPKGLRHLRWVVDVLLSETDKDDFQKAHLINALVEAGSPVAESNGWRVVELNEIRPKGHLGDALNFDRAKNKSLKSQGYADAEEFLRQM
jgi:predicted acylesterase/phospholipase RssA